VSRELGYGLVEGAAAAPLVERAVLVGSDYQGAGSGPGVDNEGVRIVTPVADLAFFARWSRCGFTGFAAHDQHRAGRVMHAVLAD
jgi:hypothetical protein